MSYEHTITYIQKRDGRLVSFEPIRIFEAIEKAFHAENINTPEEVHNCTKQVVEQLQELSLQSHIKSVSVEQTQDIVEETLIKKGFGKIAKAYILYRAQQTQLREQKVLEQISSQQLYFINNEGERKLFDSDKLLKDLKKISTDLERIDFKEIINSISRSMHNNISEKDIYNVVIGSLKEHFEDHPHYCKLGSRYALHNLYQQIFGTDQDWEENYKKKFTCYLEKGVSLELINPRFLELFDLDEIANTLCPEKDYQFMYLGIQTLIDRYLIRDRSLDRKIFELPQWLWMRVAMGMALKEKEPTSYAKKFYQLLSSFDYVSSTPTLFNSGTSRSQMSSCYINKISDSLDDIFNNYSECAHLSKEAGGIGTDWTEVRATGSAIKGTNGLSTGIIPFLKIYNGVAVAVNQGGKRKGAMAAYLEVWHKDILSFIELKKNTGDERRRTYDINTAAWIPDLFMQRVLENKEWTLFSPQDTPDLHSLYGREFQERYCYYEKCAFPNSTRINAHDLWKAILTMNYETGGPWITFKDAINVRSPQDHCGRVFSSNLCTEITLNTSQKETAVCNLGSINLAQMIKNNKLDEEKIAQTVEIAIRMLDNVIDNNFYPSPKAKESNFRHRPIGLGIMGYQDALYQLKIPFDSEEATVFADYSMEVISYHAILSSSKLAKERGTYPSYQGSKWSRGLFPRDTISLLEKERGEKIEINKISRLDWTAVYEYVKQHGIRNSNTMAIAPTATIANITGVVPCVEPIFKNIYMKENLSGNFLVVNPYLIKDLIKLNLWNKDLLNKIKLHNGSIQKIEIIPQNIKNLYKEAFEIDSKWILEKAALRSKWIDQSASTNLFINTKSGRFLSQTYMDAWKFGLKTTYYLRTMAASQITKTNVEITNSQQRDPQKKEEDLKQGEFCTINDPSCEVCQ